MMRLDKSSFLKVICGIKARKEEYAIWSINVVGVVGPCLRQGAGASASANIFPLWGVKAINVPISKLASKRRKVRL